MDMKTAKVSKTKFLTWSGWIFQRFLFCLFLRWYIFLIIFVLLVDFLPFGRQNYEYTHYYLSEVDNVQDVGILFINILFIKADF